MLEFLVNRFLLDELVFEYIGTSDFGFKFATESDYNWNYCDCHCVYVAPLREIIINCIAIQSNVNWARTLL